MDRQNLLSGTFQGVAETRHLGATREFSGTTYEDFQRYLLQKSPNKIGVSKKAEVIS